MPLTRRRLIQNGVGTAAAAVLAGAPASRCHSRQSSRSLLLTEPPFSAWADVQDAIRTSPDHLAARTAEAAASGNPEQVFAFAHDSILVTAAFSTRAPGCVASIGTR